VPEGEGEAAAPEEKKGGKKKLIMMIVLIVVIGGVAAKMTVLAPPPLTPAQKAAKADAAKKALEAKCALANGLKPPANKPAKSSDAKTTTTTVAPPAPTAGAILQLDSVTINLADGGGHYLKLGLGLQLPAGVSADTFKTDGSGAAALDYVITQLRTKASDDLGPAALEPLREQLGYAICTSDGSPQYHGMDYQGQILTIFFSDFVSQ